MVQTSNNNLNDFFLSNKELVYKFIIKYITLINDFLNYSINNQKIDNLNFFKNYIYHGLNSITHIFKYTLLRSGNIDYTYEITQKSFIDYNEFIHQIRDIDTTQINLTTTDAIIFLYKRTIFKDIEQIKSNVQIHNIMQILNEFIVTHNELLKYYIENIEIYDNNFDVFTNCIYLFTESSLLINNVNNIKNTKKILIYCILNNIDFCKIINLLIKCITCFKTVNIDSDHINSFMIKHNFYDTIKINNIETKTLNKFFKNIN